MPHKSAERIGRAVVDPVDMRRVFGHFCTGVAVLTSIDDGEPVGMTVQSLVSASLDPPLLLVCPQRSSTSWPRIARTGLFCANILSREQQHLGLQFAKSGGVKFAGVRWRPAASGIPVIEGVVAHAVAEIEATHDAGDHLAVLARVIELDAAGGRAPLLFYRGRFSVLDEERPAV